MLEEARDATDMIWQEAERERLGVEAETIRLETLRHRSLEQLGRVGHLESVLDEVRAGIGRVEEEQEDLDEATAAAAARLGRAPASSPRRAPVPQPRDIEQRERDRDDGMLSATRPDTPATPLGAVPPPGGPVRRDGRAAPAAGPADRRTTGPTQPVGDAETVPDLDAGSGLDAVRARPPSRLRPPRSTPSRSRPPRNEPAGRRSTARAAPTTRTPPSA